MKILFVCTGNICRSPMAEVLLRHRLAERRCPDVEVISAGTWSSGRVAASSGATDVLRARGIDLSPHRSRALTRELLTEADLIVAMTSVHRREILELAADAAPKIVLMKELVEIEAAHPPVNSTANHVSRLLAGTRPEWRRALDLDDPYGLGAAAYERTLSEIEAGVEALADLLCGGPRPSSV